MKFLKIIAFFICLVLFPKVQAQDSIISLHGKVYDYSSRIQLPGSLVEVLSAKDSTIIVSKIASNKNQNGSKTWYESDYYFNLPRVKASYILRFSKEGYTPTYMNLNINKFYKRELFRDIADVYLKQSKTTHLKEVTVTVTKIKFYNKGDTLVYNADAFQLAEGAMLDDLIRQLPGAELRKNGQIYVNGKFIESLLLNGKNFFKGNNQLMLENLPTYMIKDIKVYDKLGERSEFVGQEVAGDKYYVMNVNLKKKYSIGWIGNIEGGGGSKERYLARMFTMRFTDHSRVSVYGNLNNLNDDRKPGENNSWSPSELVGGQIKQQLAGLDYAIDARSGKYKLEGNLQFSHSDNIGLNNVNRTNFLPGGDTYNRIISSDYNHKLSILTDHRFYFKFKMANFEIIPKLDYHRYNINTIYSSATLLDNASKLGNQQLDSLFTLSLEKSVWKSIINRNIQQGLKYGHSLNASISASSILKFKHSPDYITLYADAFVWNQDEKRFDRNRVEYYSEGEKKSTDFRNRYFDNNPDKGYSYTGKLSYTYVIKRDLNLDLSYKFTRKYTSCYSSLYRLDRLTNWDENGNYELGVLPSVSDYERVIDVGNSYNSRLYENTHIIKPFLVWNKTTKKSKWWAQIAPSISFLNRTLHYKRGNTDTTFTKRNVLLQMYSTHIQWQSLDYKYKAIFQYHIQSKDPDMNLFVNIKDTTDPLKITVGNNNLKPSYTHNFLLGFTRMYPKMQRMWGVQLNFKPTFNAIVMGTTYNKNTGSQTFRPDNINGNWDGSINILFSGSLNKRKTLNLKMMTGMIGVHNVDFVGVEGINVSSRSLVKMVGVRERMLLDYRIGKSTIGLKSDATFNHYTSERKDFTVINSTDFNYGLLAHLDLPWNVQVSTDLTMYNRFGYNDKSMNTNDLVWNIRLSRSFLKKHFILMVDGFDVLGQLNNITRSLNAQARTETYTNVIPRYVMLHVIYRFNVKPKKSK